jgi:hypothetical protein
MTSACGSSRTISPKSLQSWRRGLLVLGLFVGGTAAAQDANWSVHPALTDRWSLQLGAFYPKVKTDAYLNGARGRGTDVSFEDDLGLDDRKAMPAILGSVRLGERWKIEAEYLSIDRDNSRAVIRTINWGDFTYTAGTTVNSAFNSDIYRLSAGYSFVKNNRWEAGAVLGLHVTDFRASLSAARVGGQTGDALAPLPTIGMYGAYAFTPRWLLSGRADYFWLNYNDYSGHLLNFNVGVDYRFVRNFGVGFGFRHIEYDLTVNKSQYNGGINYRLNGPLLYLVGSF